MVGSDIHHKTIGIIGMGKIGKAIASRALGFGMKVIYSSRNTPSSVFDTSNSKKDLANRKPYHTSLYKLVSESDHVVVCCSLNKDSYHLINYKLMKKMKKSSYLINIARGKIINQADLILALKRKLIAGAALDVYEDEPLCKNNPLMKMQNVVVLPHIGSASIETRNRMSEIAASNIKYVLEGKNLKDALLLN
jgi:glyoxylate reductase